MTRHCYQLAIQGPNNITGKGPSYPNYREAMTALGTAKRSNGKPYDCIKEVSLTRSGCRVLAIHYLDSDDE